MMEKNLEDQPIPMVSGHVLGEILRDFSNCLSLQRDMGVNGVDFSPDTVKLMDQWQRGKFRPMARPARQGVSSPVQKPRTTPSKLSTSLAEPGILLSKTRDAQPPEAATPMPSSGGDVAREGARPIQNLPMPTIQGRGIGSSGIFFLCEAFIQDENQQPDITQGPAGELFLKILKAINLNVDQAYIISFSPPPSHGNAPDEGWQKQVKTHVFKKMREINPRIICSMGETALQVMLGNNARLADGEGRFHNMATALFIPTFHPAQLIEDPSLKRAVWESIKRVIQRAGQV
ncbi:MAG: uracil-DNA glycosylase family protein [Desulfobacterium sp.]